MNMTPTEINLLIAEWAGEWRRALARFGDGTFGCDNLERWWVPENGENLPDFEARQHAIAMPDWPVKITRIPYDYCHDDEAVRRVLGRLTVKRWWKFVDCLMYMLADSSNNPEAMLIALATPLQKAEALAQLIKEEKGTK